MDGLRRLARLNIGMAILIVGINLYVIGAPLEPQVAFLWRRYNAQENGGYPYKTSLVTSTSGRAAIPSDNRLVIPRLALDERIYTGDSPYLVNKGVWARPKTSTPPQGGNTVLVGQRFTYNGKAVFYSLDQMRGGDNIIIYWLHKEYDYQIVTTKVVPPTDTIIEAPTKAGQLTLYTSTPLWSAKNRLVIVARPIGGS